MIIPDDLVELAKYAATAVSAGVGWKLWLRFREDRRNEHAAVQHAESRDNIINRLEAENKRQADMIGRQNEIITGMAKRLDELIAIKWELEAKAEKCQLLIIRMTEELAKLRDTNGRGSAD